MDALLSRALPCKNIEKSQAYFAIGLYLNRRNTANSTCAWCIQWEDFLGQWEKHHSHQLNRALARMYHCIHASMPNRYPNRRPQILLSCWNKLTWLLRRLRLCQVIVWWPNMTIVKIAFWIQLAANNLGLRRASRCTNMPKIMFSEQAIITN